MTLLINQKRKSSPHRRERMFGSPLWLTWYALCPLKLYIDSG